MTATSSLRSISLAGLTLQSSSSRGVHVAEPKALWVLESVQASFLPMKSALAVALSFLVGTAENEASAEGQGEDFAAIATETAAPAGTSDCIPEMIAPRAPRMRSMNVWSLMPPSLDVTISWYLSVTSTGSIPLHSSSRQRP